MVIYINVRSRYNINKLDFLFYFLQLSWVVEFYIKYPLIFLTRVKVHMISILCKYLIFKFEKMYENDKHVNMRFSVGWQNFYSYQSLWDDM